jgi:hypothetical protein
MDFTETEVGRRTGRAADLIFSWKATPNSINYASQPTATPKERQGNFEFRSTLNGTGVVTRDIADYSAIRALSDGKKMSYYTFHPKFEKPIRAVIRHLPIETPAEDMCNGLTELGFSLMSVRQLTTNRRSLEVDTQKLTLFLITFQKTPRSTRFLD